MSPIQESGVSRSNKVSELGNEKDGAHKHLFNPDAEASSTIRMSESPLGTTK
jgi:hypothetical protein